MASTLQLHRTVPFAVLLLRQFWSHGRRKKEMAHQFSSNNKKWISLSFPFLFPFKVICTGSSEENFFLASVFAQLLWTPPCTVSFLLSSSRVTHPLLIPFIALHDVSLQRVAHHACLFSWSLPCPFCFNALSPFLPCAVVRAPSSVYSFASISTELWLLLLCLCKAIVLPPEHGCLGTFTHQDLPSAVIYLFPSASHHMWHVEVWSSNAKLHWTLSKNYSGCAVGSFAMTCRPMTSFWQFSSANEAFLQPFMAILMGILQAL